MKTISAQEWELLSLFEVEPTFSYIDDVWPFTEAEYRVEQDQITLYCYIHPINKSFRLTLIVSNEIIYKLNVVNVKDIRYLGKPGDELLEVLVTETEAIVLRVKPEIEIEHDYNRYFCLYPDFLRKE